MAIPILLVGEILLVRPGVALLLGGVLALDWRVAESLVLESLGVAIHTVARHALALLDVILHVEPLLTALLAAKLY
jgi:hypothetical protein